MSDYLAFSYYMSGQSQDIKERAAGNTVMGVKIHTFLRRIGLGKLIQ